MTDERVLIKQRRERIVRYFDTDIEQVFNILTHAIPICPSIFAVWLLVSGSEPGIQKGICFLYGVSIPFLFSCSSAHHVATLCCRKKCKPMRSFLYLFDRAVIFLFIASSYTPWLQLNIGGQLGLNLTFIAWLIAIFGVYYVFYFCDKYPAFEIVFYVALGLGPAPIAVFLSHSIEGVWLMACGGAAYISGLIFFHAEGTIPFAHALWHCHTTLGVILHYVAVYQNLVGPEKAELLSTASRRFWWHKSEL